MIPFGSMVEYHPISAKYSQDSINLVRKCYPRFLLGLALYARGIWKGETLVADIEELENLDASETHARRLNATEVLTSKKGFIFPIADGTVKLCERDHGVRKSILMRDQPVRSEDLRGDLQGSSEKSQPVDETQEDAEARNDFWSIEGDFIDRHVEPRRNIPSDVTRTRTCWKKAELTIIGTAKWIEICQTHVHYSRSSQY